MPKAIEIYPHIDIQSINGLDKEQTSRKIEKREENICGILYR